MIRMNGLNVIPDKDAPTLSQGWEVVVAAAINTASNLFKGTSDPSKNAEQNMSDFMNQHVKYDATTRQVLNKLITADIIKNPSDWTWASHYGFTTVPQMTSAVGGTPTTEGDAGFASQPFSTDPNYIWIALDHERMKSPSQVWMADVQGYQNKLSALLSGTSNYASSTNTPTSNVLTSIIQGTTSAINSIVSKTGSPSTPGATSATLAAGLPMLLILGAAAYVIFRPKKGKG